MDSLQKRKVNDKVGFGVFATREFKKGQPILPYCGKLIDSRGLYDTTVGIYKSLKLGSYIFQFTNFRNKTHWFVT